MKRPQPQGKAFLYRSLLCLFFLLIGLKASFVAAIDGKDSAEPVAALSIRQDGVYDLRNQAVRCQPGQRVGIRVENRSTLKLTLTNVEVEGCEVGIMVTGSQSAKKSRDIALGALPPPLVRLENVRVRKTTIGMLLSGDGGIVSDNIVGEATYGIVVTGNNYVLTGNRSTDNEKDGFLVTGDRNLLEGNEARRNKGVGIHIAAVVPLVGERKLVPFIRDYGLGNAVRGNVTLNNNRDLVEFAEFNLACVDNSWINNTFQTREPECIR